VWLLSNMGDLQCMYHDDVVLVCVTQTFEKAWSAFF
jgi:hypothetical protein